MYTLKLAFNGVVINEKQVGSWRDHAREQFVKVKRAIAPVDGKDLELTLYTPENGVELTWKTETED